MEKNEKIAVLGAGNGGYACSADLTLKGYNVNLFELPSFEFNIRPVIQRGGIELSGAANVGFAKINIATTNIEKAVKDVDVVLIVVPAYAQRMFAEVIIPYLRDGVIVVFMGKGGGSLEFVKLLKEKKVKKDIIIGETCTLPYTARIIGPANVHIYATVKALPASAFPAKNTPTLIEALKQIYPVKPATNVLETLLSDLNMVVHPAPVILNAARIELGGNFQLYAEGVSPSVARVIEAVDKERLTVMKSLDLHAVPFTELVYMIGLAASKCETYLDCFTSPDGIIGARELKAPSSLNTRYLAEDVPYGLVPLASIGNMIHVPTPVVGSLVTISSLINQVDYWANGRTVEKLGIANMRINELKKFLAEGN